MDALVFLPVVYVLINFLVLVTANMAESCDSAPVELEIPHKYDVKDMKVTSVTVYRDRAEVTRSVTVKLEECGEAEVIVHNLSSSCDLDSIRVEGKGNATITEVTSVEKLEHKEVDESAAKSLKEQVTQLEREITVLESEKVRVEKHREIIVGLGDQVKTPAQTPEKRAATVNLLSVEALDGIKNFMNLYGEQLQHCDEEIFRIDGAVKNLRDQIRVLKNKSRETGQGGGNVDVIRQVSILLDVKEAGEIILSISYLVTDASWLPKYDIRVFSDDNIVKITYFGLITQKTGEDWNDTKIYLSTAQPSVGGDVPVLPSQVVSLEEPIRYAMPRRAMGGLGVPQARFLKMAARSSDHEAYAFSADRAAPPAMETLTAEVQAGVLSTSYEVPRRSTIPSDNTGHKVTVALIDLKPEFEHITVPKKVSSVFFKAKLTNDSPYLILAGPSSVFVDNNFIAKSTVPTVSASEKFEVSLGVDFAVRVDYKPCEKVTETSGYFSKWVLTRYKQVIEVKNTQQHDVKVQVEEQFPRSETDKVKVTLISPVLPKDKKTTPDSPLSMNSKGNIVWRSVIKAGATESFTLQYSIEKATDNTDIEFRDV